MRKILSVKVLSAVVIAFIVILSASIIISQARSGSVAFQGITTQDLLKDLDDDSEDDFDVEDDDDENLDEDTESDVPDDTGDFTDLFDTLKVPRDQAYMRGLVKDADGNPLSFAKIKLQSNAKTYQGISDDQGNYYILEIVPGTYTVDVTPPPLGFDLKAPASTSITLKGGQKLTYDVDFSASGTKTKTVSGTVKRVNGQAITDGEITAVRSNPLAFITQKVGGTGSFSFTLTGGSWVLIAKPQDEKKATWIKSKNIGKAEFAVTNDPENYSIDFVVDSPDATITGKVKNPDGSAIKTGTIVNLFNGEQYTKEVRSDGSFSIPVVSGAYTLAISPSDSRMSAPEPVSVSVEAGAALDVGVISLIRDNGRIKGVVRNSKTKKPVKNVAVNITMIDGGNFQSMTTGDDGSYDLSVSPGNWLVTAQPDSPRLIPDTNNVSVTVAEKQTQTVDFSLQPQSATISGNLSDEKGKNVKDADGYLLVTNSDGENFGGTISQGFYSISLAPGTYTFHVTLSPDAPYSPGNDTNLTVGEKDQNKNFNLKVDTNKFDLSGSITDEKGNKVTGVDVKVFGSDSEGGWKQDENNTGAYSFKVAPGTWTLGCEVINNPQYLSCDGSLSVDVKKASVTKNIIIKRASAVISGTIKDPTGKAMSNVYVSIDGASADPQNKDTGKAAVSSTKTDASGNFSASVPPGTYYVHAYQEAKANLINPDEEAVTAASGQTQTVTLDFKKPEEKVSGKVMDSDSKAKAGALVSAWSENGGYVETTADKNGNYSLNVSPDTWHVSAAVDSNGKGYASSANTVVTEGSGDYSLNIQTLSSATPLSPAVTQTIASGSGAALKLKQGAGAFLPATLTDTKKGTVSMSETVETRTQGTANILGTAFNIELRDSKGARVSDLIQPVVLTFPYNKNALKGTGASAKNLTPSYWDPSVGTWKKLNDVVIDDKKGIITATSKHLTRFALVSPADETPPAAPSSVKAQSTNGKVVISWTAPGVDYHHSKIYVSDKPGTVGKLLADNVAKNSFEAASGGVQYYTVHSVDLAGNESKNTDQVSVSGASTGGKVKRK